MRDAIQKAADTLGDRSAGWVHRRDAAATLGSLAGEALAALHRFGEEPDIDVRGAVDQALSHARAALEGVEPEATRPRTYPVEELVGYCEKPGARDISRDGDTWTLDVALPSGRRHRVVVTPHEDDMVRVFAPCGPAKPEAADWALRTNLKLHHCALALADHDGETQLVLVRTFLKDEATPAAMKAAVKEVAFYGDWLEERLDGADLR
jgi:hypothetical protein